MLEVSDLQVRYGEVTAVKGISIKVGEGQVVTLVGANGAGKTTTLRTISGLLKPCGGGIRFDGHELDGQEPFKITRLGLVHVPEGRMLVDEMTVRENLLTGAYCRNGSADVMADLAGIEERFPILRERAQQKAQTLSGGERQMLAIGRALMARPRLLMLDEPSLGLAPMIVDEVFRTIAELRDEGVTILLVEQNAYRALAIADYAYVLRVGNVVAEDEAGTLLKNRDVLDAYLGEV